ncbi:hypothetical protein ACIBL3_06985 [Kribbella sp. NPDC050124]|uniref:hypothetical protein n=1 Tax=Kribbella sp. NPDC050124 TaxID=3364114 RepID=UPI0037B9625C
MNREESKKGDEVVKAPAFSLTKVLAVSAPVVTVIVGLVTEWWKDLEINLNATHFTVLTVAVLAFVAVGGAADVFARAIAAKNESKARAISRGTGIYRFPVPLEAELRPGGPDTDDHRNIAVVAMSDTDPLRFLVVNGDKSLSWEDGDKVTVARMQLAKPSVIQPALSSNGGKRASKR